MRLFTPEHASMHVTHRPYDEVSHDFANIWVFLRDDYAVRQNQFIWLVSRFGDWKYGLWTENKFFPSFFRENAHLWHDERQELLGVVISESGDELFTIFTRHGYDFLYPEMLAWVMGNWNGRGGPLKTEIHECQPDAMMHLEQAGFVNRRVVAITRQYCVGDKAAEPLVLPDGYRIVDRITNSDDYSKRQLQRLAFVNTDVVRDVDLMANAYSHECPAYLPQYDLSVIAEDGKHVASCVGFIDVDNRIAEIERVCTHPDFRRQGLAQAVIRACFKRLAAADFEYAYITGYGPEAMGLYGKLGHVDERRWFLYEAGMQEGDTP
jgi:ribosomal protein S18 acetylase RimI-like enzyme